MPRPKGLPKTGGRKRKPETPHIETVYRPIAWFRPYEKNPRKNDKAVDRMSASIKEFGFAIPILARSTGEVIDGHLRLKAAVKAKLAELPAIMCDGWSDAQVKAFRLMVNRSVNWADWDMDALALEFGELKALDFDLSLTGFDSKEIDALTLTPNSAEDDVPPVPEVPVSRMGDLWLLGPHRLLCGNSTQPADVAKLLSGREPLLMVTDPPYGISLDSEWRDRAGLNGCGPILNHIKRGELVYEPFLGSGTTLAAAEATDRVCYGIELDPKYVDVIVQRWEKLAGKNATLDGDGRTFSEVAAERQLEASI